MVFLKVQKCEKYYQLQNNQMLFRCKLLEFNSDEHLDSIEIRRQVLRQPLGLDFTQEELDAEKDQFQFIVYLFDKLMGVMILKRVENDSNAVFKMRQVAVLPQYQGQGAGRFMVRFAENWARSMGAERIELHARETALNFYLKYGYNVVGGVFEEVGIPHFKMIKDLKLK